MSAGGTTPFKHFNTSNLGQLFLNLTGWGVSHLIDTWQASKDLTSF